MPGLRGHLTLNRATPWLARGLATSCLLLAGAIALRSLQWRLGDDVAFFHYVSWLVNEQGYTPYTQLHETSFPGSFAIYGLLAWLGGYSHTGFAWVNIGVAVLCALLLARILRHFHSNVALTGSALFCLWYFSQPHALYLQRDFLTVPFILGAIAVLLAPPAPWRAGLAGALFGVAASLKPHAAIGAPLVILLLANGTEATRASLSRTLTAISTSLAGFAAVWAGLLGWLVWHGNLEAFLRMATDYLPLYQRMNGIHQDLLPTQRWQNALDWVSGTTTTLSPPLLLALACLRWHPAASAFQHRLAGLLAGLWVLYLVYVGIGGKFWDYHVMPANTLYAGLLCLAFCPCAMARAGHTALHWLALAAAGLWMWAVFSPSACLELARCGLLPNTPECTLAEQDQYQAEDQVVTYLQQHLRPGDRVEPYATSTIGQMFAVLLRARALPATPYLEGFPLYHDSDTAYVQALRADMLARLQAQPPRFLLRPANFFAPGGEAASRFTALEVFIQQHYQVVQSPDLPGPAYFTLYERHTR